MPDPSPIQNPIQAIEDLRATIEQESCAKKEPFIKLGSGNAPGLNYDIPQTSAFSSYAYRNIALDPLVFKNNAKLVPVGNYWAVIEDAENGHVAARFARNIQLQNDNDVLSMDRAVFRNNLNMERSNLENVALGKTPTEAQGALLFDSANALNEVQLERLASEGLRPIVSQTFGGFGSKVTLIKKPINTNVKIYAIEEYKTVSYLGDYGAGKTLNTFSLLPGEKTTISVKTYKDITTTASRSENIIDSFSKESADEMEAYVEVETNDTNTSTWGFAGSIGVKLELGAVIQKILGNVGASVNFSGAFNATRSSSVRSLAKALQKHVEKTNHSRTVEINTTTTESIKETEETSVVRELANINKSRVLNFVFRQLLQEYVTITYLDSVKFVFCNGYPESLIMANLENLNVFLEQLIEPTEINNVKKELLKPYCAVQNYQDNDIQFIELHQVDYGACLGISETEEYYRKVPGLTDTYSAGGLGISVPGPILSVDKFTLRTESVVADALLGQGEALDCYNMKAQDAVAIKGYLENLELVQKINAIEAITDPVQRAEAYKKIFGDCCSTPQTQIIS